RGQKTHRRNRRLTLNLNSQSHEGRARTRLLFESTRHSRPSRRAPVVCQAPLPTYAKNKPSAKPMGEKRCSLRLINALILIDFGSQLAFAQKGPVSASPNRATYSTRKSLPCRLESGPMLHMG